MAQSYKICPICEAPNHRNAAVCNICGATLTTVPLVAPDDGVSHPETDYDQAYGETDLAENNLRWKGGTYFLAGTLVLAIVICVGTAFFIGARLFGNVNPATEALLPGVGAPSATPVPASNSSLEIMTNTPRSTTFLATVTPGPPTMTPSPSPTVTPTQGPCTQVVQPGDDLISILYRCGHRNFDTIIDTVVELNELPDASRIQEGQTIEVPWPTPTIDPNAVPTATSEGEAETTAEGESSADAGGETIMGVRLVPTETLQPGVTWHTVRKDENIIMIAVTYGATLRILSELNPEITFSQCDFGLGTGGQNCVVQIFEGQQIRVPAPTPTPTIQPTASGSETATPSATPTFNAPSALSPSDRAFFSRDELVTLRWVATGALGPGQAYSVRVEDVTSGRVYTSVTQDLFFIVPEDWQGQESTRHDYIWSVSVIDVDNPDKPYYATEPRMFTWQGREGS